MHKLTFVVVATAALPLLWLAGCGGGDDDPVAPPAAASTEVPASAGASVAAFVAYLQGLVADDTRDALATDALATAPTTDTEEPLPLESQ